MLMMQNQLTYGVERLMIGDILYNHVLNDFVLVVVLPYASDCDA